MINNAKSLEIDFPKWWQDSYNPALISAMPAVMVNNNVYMCPFEYTDLARHRTLKFKFLYSGLGAGWAFTFYTALMKMTRGTGGTANTYVNFGNLGVVTRSAALGSPASATEYLLVASVIVAMEGLESGLYAIAMKYTDQSGVTMPPSRVVVSSYGTSLLSTDGWWYVDGGAAAGVGIPTTIATIGAAQLHQPYFEVF